MWIERCDIFHESTNTMIRAEDRVTLKSNVANMLESHAKLLNTLETYRRKVDLMSSELLRAFLYEFYAVAHDRLSSSHLSGHTLNSSTYYRSDITLEVSELRNVTTKKIHQVSLKSSQ